MSKGPEGRAVDEGHPRVDVHNRHALRHGVEDRFELAGQPLELLLSTLAVVDVAQHPEQGRSSLPDSAHPVHFHPVDFAILLQGPECASPEKRPAVKPPLVFQDQAGPVLWVDETQEGNTHGLLDRVSRDLRQFGIRGLEPFVLDHHYDVVDGLHDLLVLDLRLPKLPCLFAELFLELYQPFLEPVLEEVVFDLSPQKGVL